MSSSVRRSPICVAAIISILVMVLKEAQFIYGSMVFSWDAWEGVAEVKSKGLITLKTHTWRFSLLRISFVYTCLVGSKEKHRQHVCMCFLHGFHAFSFQRNHIVSTVYTS